MHISLLTFFGLIQRFLKLIEFLFQLPDSKATCAKEIIVHEFKDLSTHMELLECFRSEILQVVSEPFLSFEPTIMMAVEFSIALSGIMAVDNSLNKVSQFDELAMDLGIGHFHVITAALSDDAPISRILLQKLAIRDFGVSRFLARSREMHPRSGKIILQILLLHSEDVHLFMQSVKLLLNLAGWVHCEVSEWILLEWVQQPPECLDESLRP